MRDPVLKVSAPEVSITTAFNFYIISTITGIVKPIQKLIKLTIINWEVESWFKWSTFDVSIWVSWLQEYNLFYGTWVPKPTSSAKTMTTATQSATGTTAGVVSAFSMMNTSSFSSLWSMVNQLQLLFLLLLTRAFIPEDVKAVITGSKIFANPSSLIPFENLSIVGSTVGYFDFELSNPSFDPFGMKSDSSVYNTYPFFVLILIFILMHLWIFCFSIHCLKVENKWKVILMSKVYSEDN